MPKFTYITDDTGTLVCATCGWDIDDCTDGTTDHAMHHAAQKGNK